MSGWGKTITAGETVNELRVVDVPVINKKVCKELWPGLPANVICAGGYGTDKGFCQVCFPSNYWRCNLACYRKLKLKKTTQKSSSSSQGDSGGPLVCKGIAVGVVSFNKKRNCDYPDVPNVFTDISKYRLWINSILKNPNSDKQNP